MLLDTLFKCGIRQTLYHFEYQHPNKQDGPIILIFTEEETKYYKII